MKRNMRQSFAAAMFRPELSSAPSSAGAFTPTSTFSKVKFEEHLKNQEEEKLVEIDEESEDNSPPHVFSPSPVAKKKRKTVNFLQSPKFLSPRRSFFSSTLTDPGRSLLELNSTDDGGTPKAVIRQNYKRVSLALSSRELELEKER